MSSMRQCIIRIVGLIQLHLRCNALVKRLPQRAHLTPHDQGLMWQHKHRVVQLQLQLLITTKHLHLHRKILGRGLTCGTQVLLPLRLRYVKHLRRQQPQPHLLGRIPMTRQG